ncbi:MAG TPA: hypothetical protein VGN07_13450 [Steroidobacteraceae bacterium]|jgi:hypothetical protein
MTLRFTTLAAAVALTLGGAAAGAADFNDIFSVRGFGTSGVVHSSEDRADFVGSIFQPNGAGYSHEWDMRPDTLVAGQLNMHFSDKFSAIVQAVAQYQYDETYTPHIEWANIKYQVTQDLALRAGRIVLPSFLVSESRFVGYANPWVRPPQELYYVSSITSNDGVDATYSFPAGHVRNSVQAFWGTAKSDLPTGEAEAKPSWGVNYTAEIGDAKLRAGYIATKLNLHLPSVNPIFAGLDGLGSALSGAGFQSAADQALSLANRYKLDDMQLSTYSLGASYDPGRWFVMAEGAMFKGDGFLADSNSGYITGGYRIKTFTPYLTVAAIKSDIPHEDGISIAGLPVGFAAGATGLNAGVNTSLQNFSGSQHSVSIGTRWDFMSNFDLKVQYDRLSLGENSHGRLTNTQPGFVPGGDVDLVSISVDFMF